VESSAAESTIGLIPGKFRMCPMMGNLLRNIATYGNRPLHINVHIDNISISGANNIYLNKTNAP
jgi:hypothetical protein